MMKVGVIGLGRMGSCIAMNISKLYKTFVWNRTHHKSIEHSKKYTSIVCNNISDLLKEVDIVITCLPTSHEVGQIVNENLKELFIYVIIAKLLLR